MMSFQTWAEGKLYGEFQFNASVVSNEDLDFFPTFGTLSLGAYVFPNIGVEVFADTGFTAGTDDGFELDVERAFGVALRFQSPPVRGVQGYIALGAVNYTLNQDLENAALRVGPAANEDFNGFRVSVGLMERLSFLPSVLATIEYRHYNADEPLRVDAIALGIRVNTP